MTVFSFFSHARFLKNVLFYISRFYWIPKSTRLKLFRFLFYVIPYSCQIKVIRYWQEKQLRFVEWNVNNMLYSWEKNRPGWPKYIMRHKNEPKFDTVLRTIYFLLERSTYLFIIFNQTTDYYQLLIIISFNLPSSMQWYINSQTKC